MPNNHKPQPQATTTYNIPAQHTTTEHNHHIRDKTRTKKLKETVYYI